MFVALGIQHVMRMCHTVVCGLSGSTLFFHIVSLTAQFSEKRFFDHKMCVLVFFTNFSETFLILRSIERDIVKNIYFSLRKAPVIIVIF